MRPITIYRRAVEAGLDLRLDGECLVVHGPKSVRDRHWELLRRNAVELRQLLIDADRLAALFIGRAMRSSRRSVRGKAPARRGAT